MTAPYLAEKFEVSRRTINRDIEDICRAGIPIVTTQGGNGGISIADGYKIDKSVLTYDELQSILTGLRSVESISATTQMERLFDKLSINQDSAVSLNNNIVIDLSSHYKSSLTEKITIIKEAINCNNTISFLYYYNKGESERLVEPYFIVFKWSAWYVFGYCTQRQDFRLFKLNRLWELSRTNQKFEQRIIPQEKTDLDRCFTDEFQVTILFDESVKYRLIDEYGVGCYSVADNGKLLLIMGFTNKEYLISWILGFGDKAEVLSPEELRLEIQQNAENIFKQYKGT